MCKLNASTQWMVSMIKIIFNLQWNCAIPLSDGKNGIFITENEILINGKKWEFLNENYSMGKPIAEHINSNGIVVRC